MDTNQAAAFQLSNSPSGIKTSPPYDSEIDAFVETNDLDNSIINGRSSSSSSVSGSEDGGYVSGEEEFETASERPVADEETLGKDVQGENLGEGSLGGSEMLNFKTEMPMAVVTPDDDVEKGPKVGGFGGEYVEGDGIVMGEESNGVGDGVTDVVQAAETASEGFSGKPEVMAEPSSGENSNLNQSAEEAIAAEGFSGRTEVVVEPISGGNSNLNQLVEETIVPEGLSEKPEVVIEMVSGENSNLNPLVEETIEAEGFLREPEVVVEPISGENSNLNQFLMEAIAAMGYSRKPEVMVEPILGENSILNQAVEEGGLGGPQANILEVSTGSKGDNVAEISKSDETVSSEVESSLVPEEVVREETKFKEEKALNAEDSGAGVEAKGSAEVVEELPVLSLINDVTFEPANSKLVEADGVELKNGGNSLGEAIHVKMFEPGVGLVDGSDDFDFDMISATSTKHKSEVEQSEPSGVTGSGSEAKLNESIVTNAADGAERVSTRDAESNGAYDNHVNDGLAEDEVESKTDEEGDIGYSGSDEETDGMIFGSSEAARQFMEELEQGSGGGDQSQRMIDGQIVTDSDEEVDTDEEGGGKELFDSSALAALLKAATGGGSDGGGNFTITSQDGSRLFSIERPAGLGSSARAFRPATRPNPSSFFSSSGLLTGGNSENNLTEEETKKLEKLQQIRVKFLRLVQRLGVSPDESVAAQVLYRLALVGGRQTSQAFSLDAAKRTATQLEEEGKEDLDFSVNILVLGKSGVGKSATINSIFGEEKSFIDAFERATTTVKEISGVVDGVKIKVFDTPGLKSGVMEQGFNRRVLSSVTKVTKKSPPDIVLYVDRLDSQTRDLNDMPLLKTITGCLGQSIWRSAIVTLTHAASAPPDGPSGSPLSYDVFVTQRSHVVQQSIGQAVGDLRMMSPSLMNPVSLVENHPLCRKNREGQKVLPNGQTWRPQLLLLGYSMKILAEASSLSKPQDPFDHRKLFGFRSRSPPLPYLLSSMLQTRAHPKLSTDQGIENGDSDVDMGDLSDFEQEEEGEVDYDELPAFKPLSKAQLAKLSKEDKEEYFEEYDYRVKLLNKKQWREELKRMKEMKKKGKDAENEYGFMGGEDGDQDNGSPAPVSTPLPDMVLPPSFDSDSPAYRYRFLEPTSQFLARPVLDTHGWDHDCGYDGVNLEQSLAIANRFPAAVSVQITKDKKDFSIHLDSSISAKHGENGSTMAGFDIQNIGKQLAYIVRGETKFKNIVRKRKNKTAAGVAITFLGENVATGLKVEDQIALGKQWALVGSCGTVRCQSDAAYGANFELQRRELDYPVGQVQSTYGLSLIKWKGDWALGFNTVAQFSIGRGSKVALRAGINNKMSGQITVRTSSSEHLGVALAAVIPVASAIYKKIWPAGGGGESYSIY
ncbi:hypothetical protein RHMOL_Rhmol13G0015800 [Rhododendron molle]|uniref:Uncharacterized protein n=1 Tax=Rhododendron molle TaxID=49168 RepID=A0ACC0L1W1_RHOML|nr:hypothetical protein RHMOL_Rhmol13G0015800 [Rhododendron molle]